MVVGLATGGARAAVVLKGDPNVFRWVLEMVVEVVEVANGMLPL